MLNQDLAKIFYEMAQYLDMEENAVPFKSIAFKKVAVNLESLNEDAGNIYKKGGLKALMEIPGVGEGIAFKIEEYLKTGKIKRTHAALKKKTPVDLEELIRVEGLGTRKVKILYQKLGVRNIKDLEKAAKTRKISALIRFWRENRKKYSGRHRIFKKKQGRIFAGRDFAES